jgi:hypothetical protein
VASRAVSSQWNLRKGISKYNKRVCQYIIALVFMLLQRRINGMWDKIIIDMILAFYYLTCSSNGAVAQLGERLNGIQEARGSTPLSSTRR